MLEYFTEMSDILKCDVMYYVILVQMLFAHITSEKS